MWDVAELITICARRSHRGIHPGANVALDLLIWLGAAASVALLGIFLSMAATNYRPRGSYSYYDSYNYYYYPSGTFDHLRGLAVCMGILLYVVLTQ
jgi:hypothetical protein